MTRKERTLARRLANGGTFTVLGRFKKGARQMRFRIDKSPVVRFARYTGRPYVKVYDLDREDTRTLRLAIVSQLTELKASS